MKRHLPTEEISHSDSITRVRLSSPDHTEHENTLKIFTQPAIQVKSKQPRDNPSRRKVGYAVSNESMKIASLLPSNLNRSYLVHTLAKAYGLLSRVKIIKPKPLSADDLKKFHSSAFIDFILTSEFKYASSEETTITKKLDLDEQLDEYGLTHDCPIFDGLGDYVRYVAGGSVAAARALIRNECDVAIHWDGGRHHARKSSAQGFCYISDIVLAIIELRQKFDKVMYIDIDIHHGDGVENAFLFSDKVLTISFHRYEVGFYPTSGSFESIGRGRGEHHTINVPLRRGLRGATLEQLFREIVLPAFQKFQPDAIVMQCGLDGLVEDPIGEWNINIQSVAQCVMTVVELNVPVLLVGGGGYKSPNVARCYSYVLSVLLEQEIPNDIPEHIFFEEYGPDFTLLLDEGNQKDLNDADYINKLVQVIRNNIDKIK